MTGGSGGRWGMMTDKYKHCARCIPDIYRSLSLSSIRKHVPLFYTLPSPKVIMSSEVENPVRIVSRDQISKRVNLWTHWIIRIACYGAPGFPLVPYGTLAALRVHAASPCGSCHVPATSPGPAQIGKSFGKVWFLEKS